MEVYTLNLTNNLTVKSNIAEFAICNSTPCRNTHYSNITLTLLIYLSSVGWVHFYIDAASKTDAIILEEEF
jgi:hypothetical protein